ncbi:uncharacterized protein LOC109832228 isoform X2 [Asparagus officinalis]|nr:uncharacterized protein LOC109832228 isoform X2 [Asparagus officinalis]
MPDGRKRVEPQWLDLLLKKKFFGNCNKHRDSRKSEINIYCTECDVRMCSHCITEDASHRCHRLLQIRRYVYSDVVKIDEMQKHIDCSKIQPYSLNQAKVIFLNPKSKKSKPSKPPHGTTPCNHCRRSISAPNRYCSIACKVSYEPVDIPMLKNKSGPLILPSTPDLEDISPQVVELPSSSLSWSSSQPSDSAEENHDRPINQEATPKLRVRMRKGIPRRAPFF